MQTQIKKASESMERRVSHMQQEFSEIRAGRAKDRKSTRLNSSHNA